MTNNRTRAGVVVAVVTLACLSLPFGAASAPQTLEVPVPAGALATAVRLAPPAPSSVDLVVQRVNSERALRGLGPLVAEPRLAMAAQLHSQDQAAMNRMSHTGSNGSGPAQRIAAAGYSARSWAENVAAGYGTPDAVVTGWINSPGHYRNLMSANVHVGVGLARSASGTPYWTLVVASPR